MPHQSYSRVTAPLVSTSFCLERSQSWAAPTCKGAALILGSFQTLSNTLTWTSNPQ